MLEYYKEDNEKIAREYLGREDGVLFYDKRRDEKDDYPGLSLQAALDISRELVIMLKNKEQGLQDELGNTREYVNALQAQINDMQTSITNLHNSTSWRITKPLRFIKRLLTRQ
jgi:hypothetical protein